MKTLFIEARKKIKLNKEKLKELISILPTPIYITYSIQYKELAERVKEELGEKGKGKQIIGFSQVLGCSELETNANTILLIGQGRFHALNLAINSGKEVVVFDNYSISKITKEEIARETQKEKGKYLKFLYSSAVGILISTKPGQNNLSLALKLKEKLGEKKKVYLFLADNINPNELENFPCEIFINTACSGISLDSPRILNYKTMGKLSLG